MTEGPGLAAAGARAGGDVASPADPVPAGQPAAAQPVSQPAEAGRHRRVDARHLEAALLELRRQVVDVTLVFETAGAEQTRAERRKLLSQIDDYLLPRVRQSGAPLLVALVGSTGAGKSTLVNSIVGVQVSKTGIRRPTTNSPVLACHPDDVDWFAENVFLPTVPRVRQEGLARSGRDGLLVLAANEGMPKGVALLDTPDIDSVVQAHREFAHQFLDASDLWLFMTTASRYADAAVWELLEYAKERGAALGIVLSRVPPSGSAELTKHFGAMLRGQRAGRQPAFRDPRDGDHGWPAAGRDFRPGPGVAAADGGRGGPPGSRADPDHGRRAGHVPHPGACHRCRGGGPAGHPVRPAGRGGRSLRGRAGRVGSGAVRRLTAPR